jgi:hypothetical protein
MNLYQAALLLAQAERTADVTGHPVKNIRGVKADRRKPFNARKKAAFRLDRSQSARRQDVARRRRFAGGRGRKLVPSASEYRPLGSGLY